MPSKRIFVSLPDGVWEILKNDFRNRMGDSESEIIRNIVIAYLSHRGYFVNSKGYEDTAELHEKINVLENMILSSIELLEEKGSLTFNEWQNRIKKKIIEQDDPR